MGTRPMGAAIAAAALTVIAGCGPQCEDFNVVLGTQAEVDARARHYREVLRRAMEEQGFAVYEHEWWHFDFHTWREYPVGNEPL